MVNVGDKVRVTFRGEQTKGGMPLHSTGVVVEREDDEGTYLSVELDVASTLEEKRIEDYHEVVVLDEECDCEEEVAEEVLSE